MGTTCTPTCKVPPGSTKAGLAADVTGVTWSVKSLITFKKSVAVLIAPELSVPRTVYQCGTRRSCRADSDRKGPLRTSCHVAWIGREPAGRFGKSMNTVPVNSRARNNLYRNRERAVLHHRRGRAGGRHWRHAEIEIRLKDERCVGGRRDGARGVAPCQNQRERCRSIHTGGAQWWAQTP